jgi:hypothetical protein
VGTAAEHAGRTGLETHAARAPGPVVRRRRRIVPRASLAERCLQATVLLVCGGLLALGVALVPSPEGVGTHTQLGLAPCGMLETTGRPCPTCGLTTAFTLAARGRLVRAFVTQPFGVVLFGLTVLGLVFSALTLATGASWYPLAARYNVTALVLALILLMLVSWAYKWSVT